MVGLLAEAEYQDQDQRYWLLAQKADNPIEAYRSYSTAIEEFHATLEQQLASADETFESDQLNAAQLAWIKA